MKTSTQHHVVIGAGATGAATARLLANTGHQVTVITRSGSGPELAGITRIATDATDADELRRLSKGAAVMYNCANPPYHRWATDWPPLAASILSAAEANDAVLVTLSNLYAYPATGRPMRATDPLDPPSDKGEVRAAMWHDALAAHRAGRVRVTEARASDFVGPGLGDNGHLGDRVTSRVLASKSVSVLGDPDQPHSWTAIDDVARTLVTLGADERSLGRAWHVPTSEPATQREMVHRMCELAGVAPVKVSSIPKLALWAAGLVMPVMRELRKVAYQFEAPFVIDSHETTDVFGIAASSVDDSLRSALGLVPTPV